LKTERQSYEPSKVEKRLKPPSCHKKSRAASEDTSVTEASPLEDRIFPITYAGARIIVKKAGDLVPAHLKPYDLPRHAATYASRSGTPLEIVSKVLLRHANLSTTQIYLKKISDGEAIRWIDTLHGLHLPIRAELLRASVRTYQKSHLQVIQDSDGIPKKTESRMLRSRIIIREFR
jgi:hypothetical protein